MGWGWERKTVAEANATAMEAYENWAGPIYTSKEQCGVVVSVLDEEQREPHSGEDSMKFLPWTPWKKGMVKTCKK